MYSDAFQENITTSMLHIEVYTWIAGFFSSVVPCRHSYRSLHHCKLTQVILQYHVVTTVQLNLNLTEHVCSKGMTRHIFISHTYKPTRARKIGDVKPAVQSSRVRTRRVHDALVHVRNAHAKFGLRMHANGQRNKLYKHVHVLRCNPPRDTRHKSC